MKFSILVIFNLFSWYCIYSMVPAVWDPSISNIIYIFNTVVPLLVATLMPLSLIRPQIFGATTHTTSNVLLPFTKGHLTCVATISWQIVGFIREGLQYESPSMLKPPSIKNYIFLAVCLAEHGVLKCRDYCQRESWTSCCFTGFCYPALPGTGSKYSETFI